MRLGWDAGTPDAMTRVHDAFPRKHCYWTEGGPDYSAPDYATDWASWSHTFSQLLRNRTGCIVGWNLLLDENGTPNIGPFSCGGLLTVDSRTHQLTVAASIRPSRIIPNRSSVAPA